MADLKMSPEQKETVLGVISLGISCGLTDVLEAFTNWHLHVPQLMPYDDAPEAIRKVDEAFVALFNASPSCPEDEENPFTLERLERMVEAHYTYTADKRKQSASDAGFS